MYICMYIYIYILLTPPWINKPPPLIKSQAPKVNKS